MTSLIDYARDGNLTEVTRLLAQPGTDVNAADIDGGTALYWAVFKGNTAITNALLDKDADVNAVNKSGWTALHWAAYKGKTETAKALLEDGANVNAVNKHGKTALHLAELKGKTETTKALLENGATANKKEVERGTSINTLFKGKYSAPKMVPIPSKKDLFCPKDFLLTQKGDGKSLQLRRGLPTKLSSIPTHDPLDRGQWANAVRSGNVNVLKKEV